MDEDAVTLVVEADSYGFSKKKLSECSGYFKAMFSSDFVEKNKSVIKLEGVSARSLEHIWQYVTHGKIKQRPQQTSPEEWLDLLQAATMFQLTEIQDCCSKILSDILDVANVLPILEIASRLDSTDLLHKARAVALWNFDDVTRMDAFYRLNVSQVVGYVSEPEVNCSTGELGVWEAIERWLTSSEDASECRYVHLGKLVQCLHLESLSTSDLRYIAGYESVKGSPVVSGAIRRVISERSSGCEEKKGNKTEESEEVERFIEEWRKTERRKLPYVPAVAGSVYTNPEASSPWILKFCEVERKFIPVLKLKLVENYLGSVVGFKVISSGSKLYMLGGKMMTYPKDWNYAVWMYDQIHRTWTFLSDLLKPSRHMSACCMGDDLYVIGGFGRHRVKQDSVTKLNVTERLWTTCAPLPQPSYSDPCCVFRNHIYVIGARVYEYIPSRDVWLTLSVPLSSNGYASAMANEDFIFLSEAYTGNVYRLNPSDPSARPELLGTFKNACSQACLIDDHIYSLSQETFGEEIYCEKLNVRTGESTVLWEGTTDEQIDDLSPKHHHGCFPLLMYCP